MAEIYVNEEIKALESELEALENEYEETLLLAIEKGEDAPEWDLLVDIKDDILDVQDEICFVWAEQAEDTSYYI